MFHRVDVEALVAGFTADCVFRFAEQPERRGRAALREFFSARLSRQKDYRSKKTLLALEGNVLTNVWEWTWEDRRRWCRGTMTQRGSDAEGELVVAAPPHPRGSPIEPAPPHPDQAS